MSNIDKKQTKKWKNKFEDETDFDEDFSFDSEETTFNEQIDLLVSDDISDISKDLRQENSIPANISLSQSIDSIFSNKIERSQLSDSPSHIFPSMSRLYQLEIYQNLMKMKQNAMQFNSMKKTLEANTTTIYWKLSFLKKVINQDQKGKQYLERAHRLMFMNGINLNEIEPREITFSKCECGKSTMDIYKMKKHLKKTSHKLLLSIDTKNARKYQSRIYDQIGKQAQVEKFDKSWLYKSFEVFFIQAEIHYSQLQQKTNKQFLTELLNLKGFDQINEKSSRKQNQTWFIKKWIDIYRSLHEIHKGKEALCHKCMNIEDHFYLFALGLNEFITKNRKTIFNQMSHEEFRSISVFVQGILKDFVLNSKQKQKIKQTIPNSRANIRVIIRNLLLRYFNSFDYIDLNETAEYQHQN